jgi:hypothetical protein
MKIKSFLFICLPVLLAACSKKEQDIEKQLCIKGKVIGTQACSTMWGVQIIDGPQIGESFEEYDNVIELYGVEGMKTGRDNIIYFTYRDAKASDYDAYKSCPTFDARLNFSKVEKTIIAFSEKECP